MSQLDDELRAIIAERLSTALLGDVLDAMGYRHQFLPPDIRPMLPGQRLVGWAVPVLEADFFDDHEPFGLMFEALDSLGPGEIYLATGGSRRYAMWGELMTVAAQARRAAGAVLDGYVRDTAKVVKLGLPVFACGSYAQDQRVRGRVVAYRVPVEVKGVGVNPGDLLVGDQDGVLVVPAGVALEVTEQALHKAQREQQVRDALLSGASVAETFRRFGVM